MLFHRVPCDVPNKSNTGAWLFTDDNSPCLPCHDPWWAKGHDSQRVNLFHLLLTTEQALLAGLLPGECGPWPLREWDIAVKALPNKHCNLARLPQLPSSWLNPVVKQAVNNQEIMNLKGRGKDGVQPPKRSVNSLWGLPWAAHAMLLVWAFPYGNIRINPSWNNKNNY